MLKSIILSFVLLSLLLLISPVISHAGDVVLPWDANTETDLAGYTIHHGTSSGVYTTDIPVGNVTTHTLPLNAGTHYIVVSANDTSGNISDNSYEIKLTVKVGTPTGLGAN